MAKPKDQQKTAIRPKTRISPKIRYKTQLLNFLSNPDNDFVTRRSLAADVLHVDSSTLYKYFPSEELSKIELEALEMRRGQYAPQLSDVDKALLKRAKEDGDPAACKLVYQKFEGWKEVSRNENTGKDGGPIKTATELSMTPEIEAKILEIIGKA